MIMEDALKPAAPVISPETTSAAGAPPAPTAGAGTSTAGIAPPPAGSSAPTVVPPGMMLVDAQTMNDLMGKIKMLEFAADKGMIEKFRAANAGAVGNRKVSVTVVGGKVITAWKTVKNDVWKDQNNVWREVQTLSLTNEDGESFEMPYVEFNRTRHEEGEIISTRVENGLTSYKIRLAGGKIVELDTAFIN